MTTIVALTTLEAHSSWRKVHCEIDGTEFKGKVSYRSSIHTTPTAYINDMQVFDVKIYYDGRLLCSIPPKEETMNLTARGDQIRDRLLRYLLSMGAPASPIPAAEWPNVIDVVGPYARFGIGWPKVNPSPDIALSVPFCPEIIDQVTAELDDTDLDDYLGTVEWLMAVQLNYVCDGIPVEDAFELAYTQLHDEAQGSQALLEDTQARALDRGIGR